MKLWPYVLIAAAIFSDSVGAARAQDIQSELARTDPNSFVVSVQAALKSKGLYDGDKTGVLDQGTISAINVACRAANLLAKCQIGPLSPSGAFAVTQAISSDGSKLETTSEVEVEAAFPLQTKSSSDEEPVLVSGGDDLNLWSTNFGTSSVVEGRFRVTTGQEGYSARQYYIFPTKVGATYTVEVDAFPATAGAAIGISPNENISGAALYADSLTGTYSGSFVATTGRSFLLLVAMGTEPGSFAEFDDIQIVQKPE